MKFKKALAALIVPVGLLVAACGSSGSSTSAPASSASAAAPASSTPAGGVQLTTRTLPGLGTVLADGSGRTLYAFAPDHAKSVTCMGACASVWPPLTTASGAAPATAGQVNAAMVSSDANPAGGRVLTYGGWPLYRYVGDPTAGTAHGQGLDANGGYWYVVSPAGRVIARTASGAASSSSGSGGSSSSGSGGSYGY